LQAGLGDSVDPPQVALFVDEFIIGAVGKRIVLPCALLRCDYYDAALIAGSHVPQVVGLFSTLKYSFELRPDLREPIAL
jgi:hypothetical protein